MRKKLKVIGPLIMALLIILAMGSFVSADDQVTLTPYTGQDYDASADGVDYSIGTAAQLAKLAERVNNIGTSNTYAKCTFTLTADINLAVSDTYTNGNTTLSWTGGDAWTPIGGMWGQNTGSPSGKYFGGIFNGNGHSISGMSVSSDKSGTGLFGYVNGGVIGNLTVNGTVQNTDTKAATGGIVGYTNGSLVKCTSNVNVTATNSSQVTNVGGLAGIVENTATSVESANTVWVYGCVSKGNVEMSRKVQSLNPQN